MVAAATTASVSPPLLPPRPTHPTAPAGGLLQQQLKRWLEEAEAVEGQHARAIIAPHAGYRCARWRRAGGRAGAGRCCCGPLLSSAQAKICNASSPAATCRYSGHVAAYAYKQIDPSQV